MKKVFDQTVRDLKREVNKKVLKVPGIEQKILDATSNEPWGPHGSHLADIAQATRNYHEYQIIMMVIWKRINDTGKNWRHVYKALTVLEYLVAHGSERIIDEIREHAYQISTLSDFQYIDSGGRDQGSNIRRKSQSLVALVNDKERIQEVRQKALANRDKFRSTFSTGGTHRPSSYSGTGGSGDRYDDDRSEGRYGGRDDDRNGYGRERDMGYRDDDRYGRSGDPYNREGDRYGRDSDERYGRDSYRDDDYRGGRGNDDYQQGSRSRSVDGDKTRSFDDDDRYSSRSGGGGRADDASQDERGLERKLSEQNVAAPPSYEEAIRDARNHIQDGRDGGTVAAPIPKESSPPAPKAASPESTNQVPDHIVAGVAASIPNKEVDSFDEFDPRGSVSAAPLAASSPEMDFFGSLSASDSKNSLALVPVTFATTTSEADMPTSSGFGANYVSSTSTFMSQPSEDPFGDSPFKATQENFPPQPQTFAAVTSFQPSSPFGGAEPPPPVAGPRVETIPSFDFGDSLGGITYTPGVANGQHPSANPGFLSPELPVAQASSDILDDLFPQAAQPGSLGLSQAAQPGSLGFSQAAQPMALISSQASQPAASTNIQIAQPNLLPHSGLSTPLAPQAALMTSAGPPSKTQPSKDKFETKSTVWADTLNRGLVNLNISGAKINPLADIGIDFDSINRMEKRKEKSSATAVTSTITMGKAMGSGSGIGRAGTTGLAPPPNPMLSPGMGMGMGMGMGGGGGMGMGVGTGMGMGMGMGMNQPMGMGMNQPMGMGMGMNMGMNQPMGMGMGMGGPVRPGTGMPPPGMPGVGYNPMMGVGSYGSQPPPYGGGYR